MVDYSQNVFLCISGTWIFHFPGSHLNAYQDVESQEWYGCAVSTYCGRSTLQSFARVCVRDTYREPLVRYWAVEMHHRWCDLCRCL